MVAVHWNRRVHTFSPETFCNAVLIGARGARTADFVGLGVVFYSSLARLQHVDLGDHSARRPPLPVSGVNAIATILAEIADAGSPWHDGFHFVDVSTARLTHLSQFLSPSLEGASSMGENRRPFGARHMASLLASCLDGIVRVGLVSPAGEISYFENGMCRVLELKT
jgi:hypothetical protein